MKNLSKLAQRKPGSDAMNLTIEFRYRDGKRREVDMSEDTGIVKAGIVRFDGRVFEFKQKGEADYFEEVIKENYVDLDAIMRDTPNIEDVFSAFQEFQNDSRRAATQPILHERARTVMREKFRAFGLEDMIDWSDKS